MAATSAAESTFGTTMPAGPGLGRGAEVGLVPLGLGAVHPDGELTMAVLPRGDRGSDLVPRSLLHVGSDGVLGVEDDGVARQALGLLERLVVGARHVEGRAAGSVVSVHLAVISVAQLAAWGDGDTGQNP